MKDSAFCSICLQSHRTSQRWFLLSENRWTDQLRIFRWDQELAQYPEFHSACGVAHVQQLVVHWMTTGNLNYPFACTEVTHEESNSLDAQESKSQEQRDVAGVEILGELAVDRDSMSRILVEDPESLGSLLSALSHVLAEPRSADEACNKAPTEDRVCAFVDA